jgi:uncharacterized protein YceK
MPRAYACLALLTVVAVVLAGCGSTTSTTSASVASQPSTAAATTPAAASAAGVHTTPTTSIATQGKATGTTTGEGPVHAAATVSTSPSQLCSTFTEAMAGEVLETRKVRHLAPTSHGPNFTCEYEADDATSRTSDAPMPFKVYLEIESHDPARLYAVNKQAWGEAVKQYPSTAEVRRLPGISAPSFAFIDRGAGEIEILIFVLVKDKLLHLGVGGSDSALTLSRLEKAAETVAAAA